MSKLTDKLGERGLIEHEAKMKAGPIWKGPQDSGPDGGITFSLLSRFLICRERFRLRVVEGLKPVDTFSHRIEYGNMWHVCEESSAAEVSWEKPLIDYVKKLAIKYPIHAEQMDHWYNVCRVQFPIYVEYWKRNPDVKYRTPLWQEQTFSVPYKLPSGQIVYLRGKFDSLDIVEGRVWLQENKTKGDIDEVQMQRQLNFDLQTMLYLVALAHFQLYPTEIGGVRYNVVRRPLSGGKGSIVRHKPSKSNPAGESKESFYGRVADVINGDLGHFFMRWKVPIVQRDITKFRTTCLDPILENLCYWWAQVSGRDYWPDNHNPQLPSANWRHPFGVYNSLDEGGSTDLDAYLENGCEVGLVRGAPLFEELR